MNDRDCANCGNRSDRGCKVWECEFKPVFSESKQPIIEELEKIKAEIEKEREEMTNAKDWGRYYGLGLSIRIIDKHISELKEGAE